MLRPNLFLELASQGARAALAVDLFLHDEADPEAMRQHGPSLARVITRAAEHWQSPLALPLMDLRIDKADLLAPFGLDFQAADRFHFDEIPHLQRLDATTDFAPQRSAYSRARDEAVRIVAQAQRLFPVGLVIGPFSLTTKLLADPITPVALWSSGSNPDGDDDVRRLVVCHELATRAVLAAVERQLAAGAEAMIVCEPAASTAFFSPRHLKTNPAVFHRLVIAPNLLIKQAITSHRALLFFHDCGELIPSMVETFGQVLHPAVLSLGSSRLLWEDALLVPPDVVLFGNLPSKSFYSDHAMPLSEVARRATELVMRMRQLGHPHILGTECDVLHVPEAAATIRRKVECLMTTSVPVHAARPTHA